jgi:hypothetical protein
MYLKQTKKQTREWMGDRVQNIGAVVVARGGVGGV